MRLRFPGAYTTLITVAAVIGLGGAGLTALALQPHAAAAEATADAMPYAVEDFPHDLQVMSWNMCGSQRATWHCEGTGTPDQKTSMVTHHVDTNRVQAALLQEVCEDDLTLLMSKLGPDWSKNFEPYQWAQDGKKWPSRCGEDTGRADRIGTAIVVKGQISDARQYPITQPETGQQSPLQCATALAWGVRLCSVHAARVGANPDLPKEDYRDEQFAELKAIVDTFPKTVFGGDFNSLSPDDPNNTAASVWPVGLYSTGPGTPGYQECDQSGTSRTGRPTHAFGGKIDYIFSSETKRWCTVTDTPYSDHHILIESLSLR
ncbi:MULTISPECIES: endonuclease/exonuclease/phosphatase family protein [unclassified Streptomyces]|uniref:endonuclease/exonuclease/phosphatase family protein n=1 Tax=unclassified Streptomyces TaxID=2593676 RepID=UPI0027E458FF|nr:MULTISPECIES: endonuclease/exonuclease/phosphatase family protein [unclassified Streptomyces]